MTGSRDRRDFRDEELKRGKQRKQSATLNFQLRDLYFKTFSVPFVPSWFQWIETPE
jgi:hypothetical protein